MSGTQKKHAVWSSSPVNEASQYGSPEITTEHLLLGLIREDSRIFEAILQDIDLIQTIDEELRTQESLTAKQAIPTSHDLPLSNPGKRVLAYAAEEAERLGDRHIGTEHLLMGVLREASCPAAEVLRKYGVDLPKLRERSHQTSPPTTRPLTTYETAPFARLARDAPIEFLDDATQARIAVSAMPLAIPAIGEEVILEEEAGSVKFFRVTDVTYVFTPREEITGSKKLSPVVVTLRHQTKESNSRESGFKPR